jgi:hypothetical protein
MRPRDQRVVVVSVDFRVAVVSPVGDMVVPLEVVSVELVTTPLTLVVFWVVVSTSTRGAMTTGAAVDWVVVVVEDEDCAKAPADIPPVTKAAANVAASGNLVISISPEN